MTTTPTGTTTTPATRTTRSRWTRAVALTVGVAVVAVGAVLGAQALLTDRYTESRSYASAAAIPEHNGPFFLPEWAPADAHDITIEVQTQGRGRSLTLETSTSGVPAGCTVTPPPVADPVPDLDLGAAQGEAGYRCEDWFVVRDGERLVAWTAYDVAS